MEGELDGGMALDDGEEERRGGKSRIERRAGGGFDRMRKGLFLYLKA